MVCCSVSLNYFTFLLAFFVHTSVENVSLSARGNAVSPPFSGSFKYNKTVASLQYNNNINMFYALEGNVFREIYGYGYDKKICKTSLVSLCWWSTLFISIEQNVMVSLHLPLPTIYITINKTKWFGLGSSSVGEMIVPRHTKIVRVRTYWKRAHAERSYKVNKGVLRHVKTIDLARTLVMKRREREKHSLTNMSSPFFLGRFVSPLLRLELLLSNFQI